ncbi:Apoptosis-antagonizing transcription factor C-terminal [Penicillium robsamsonii]|uniref:Apoptosis-antagonizing transcription factor C-terminal n=1 Tax=Penicillium robsamsonii TaxID=1792511 RepID=UPI0025478910|nr:Apoptosis-antagonizing transcription factor C-terminal [Penicillium robsamsonii]KAJ5822405.1 Apoptosis-antagonizing transcription factor C-terminal [Penicillium robsamsonii]
MGKPRAARSLADQLADFEDPTPKDFDPEDIDNGQQSSDDEDEDKDEVNTGREHYQTVGKAKLRKDDPLPLGKQYEGARVSRAALGTESEDDEDSEGFSVSEESDDALALEGSDEDIEGDEDEHSEEDGESDAEDDDDDEDGEEHGKEVVDKHSKRSRPEVRHGDTSGPSGDRDEIRKLMATDQKTIAATISSAAKADATKGKAVKQQRTTFDALLNARMKLQSGLTSINGIAAVLGSKTEADGENAMNDEEEVVDEEAIKSAESAALALWSTLEGLRTALADATAKEGSKKRKRPSPASPATSSASLWERMSELESESISHRRSVLDKWSSKVRGTSASLPNARGKLLGSSSGRQQTITAVLDAQVATEIGERSSKRSRTSEQEPLYDDGAFYQSLLRDLVEQRMSSSDSMTNGFDNLHQLPSRLPIHPITGMRNDKVKRDIDTRASKGRKMKYTVHEKLQNFMAPDDRGSWSTRARDEFFASLLGKSASGLLGEGDEGASDEEDEIDREEGGLKLFRN